MHFKTPDVKRSVKKDKPVEVSRSGRKIKRKKFSSDEESEDEAPRKEVIKKGKHLSMLFS